LIRAGVGWRPRWDCCAKPGTGHEPGVPRRAPGAPDAQAGAIQHSHRLWLLPSVRRPGLVPALELPHRCRVADLRPVPAGPAARVRYHRRRTIALTATTTPHRTHGAGNST